MGKGFFDKPASTTPKTYTKTVSFVHCNNDALKKERYRIQLINDNIIFLNSVVALLTDRDRPFLEEKDYNMFLEYISSTRPEVQDRVKTLKFIRDNRNVWFNDGSYIIKKQNIIALGDYLQSNPRLLERLPECLNKDLDINYTVVQAIKNPNFNMANPQNPVRKAWDNLKIELNKVFKPQDLYASK